MSQIARALIIASAAAAVALEAMLATHAAAPVWQWTLIVSLLVAVPARVAPAAVPPIVASVLFLAPVISFAMTGVTHASAVTPVIGALLTSVTVAAPRPSAMPPWWRDALTLWALIVALAWPIVALREMDFSWSVLWNFRVPTAAGGFPAPAVVLWITHAAASQLVGLLWAEYLWAVHAGPGAMLTGRLVKPFAATALGASLLSVYQGYVDLEFLSTSIWPYLRRAAGALVDANPSGMLSAMWLTGFIALAASTGNRAGRGMAILGAVASALATWCSGSRSALAAAAIGVGVTLIWSVRAIHLTRRVVLTGLGFLAGAALAMMLFTGDILRPRSTSPLGRIAASMPAGPVEAARWLWNRDGYGPAAVQMIREFPVAGVGVGTFHSIGVDYTKKFGGTALPPDNAQNWYRHQMAELGIVGSAGWLAFVGLFVITIVRTRPTRENSFSANALRGGLAGLAIASLVGMPAQHPAIILTFWTFAFWLLQVVAGPERPGAPGGETGGAPAARTPRMVWPLVVAIVVVHTAATLYSSRHDLRVPYRAARFDFDYSYGFVREEGGQHVWIQDHAVIVPPAPTCSLQLTLWSDTASEARPLLTEISIEGTRVIRRTLRGSQRLVEVVSVPGENKRFVLEVDAHPASAGEPRPRLALQWEFLK